MTSGTVIKQGMTNHVTFVLDRSGSMHGKEQAVIRAMDMQIKSLAEMSQELDQETRVTIVIFDHEVDVLVYDKDVLRLPSIAECYTPRGRTALIDATLQAIDDLAKLPELYADHAFLLFALTDGLENESRNFPSTLSRRISSLGDNWTVAALVPDRRGEQKARECGFLPGNIMVWDATSVTGFEQAAATIQRVTETFMTNRAAGIRGSRSVFSTSTEALNKATVQAAGLTPLKNGSYQLVHVTEESAFKYPQSRDWVEKEVGHPFRTGCLYYQLTKSEKIQPQKKIAVLERSTGRVFSGDAARSMLGLPDMEVRVKPDYNKDFAVFVQSTSTNRKLVAHTRVLLMA